MRTISCVTLCVVCCLAISLPALAIEISIEAVKEGKVPVRYARVAEVSGQEKVVFNKSSTFYSPSALNTILNAYGVYMTPEAYRVGKIPRSCASCVEEGGLEKLVFSEKCCFYGPSTLNNILNAYGVNLTIEALEAEDCRVPTSYARVVEIGGQKKVLLGDSGTFYDPSTLNDILNAYE